MATQSLAIKYRPHDWDSVTEQNSIKIILQQQLNTGTFQHAYLFCGGAGTGKTTSARIFASNINNGKGNPIELDAASNNSVEDVRNLIQQAKTVSIDSEYKVFILDEVHSLSNSAWQALLKLIEEPPAKSIFIFCTTDPQKIPKTILSRVQRYDFQKISQEGIIKRLNYVIEQEGNVKNISQDAIQLIAKLAAGGMRDALTLLDKCLSYSEELTVDNVTKALGMTGYEEMFKLLNSLLDKDNSSVIKCLDNVDSSGRDLKLYIKQFTTFVLDVCKYQSTNTFKYIQIPQTYSSYLNNIKVSCIDILDMLIHLNYEIKWDTQPKAMIESCFLLSNYNR